MKHVASRSILLHGERRNEGGKPSTDAGIPMGTWFCPIVSLASVAAVIAVVAACVAVFALRGPSGGPSNGLVGDLYAMPEVAPTALVVNEGGDSNVTILAESS